MLPWWTSSHEILAQVDTDMKQQIPIYLCSPVQNCLQRKNERKLPSNRCFRNERKDGRILCVFLLTRERSDNAQLGGGDNLKFSAVLGATSAKSSILILPAGMVPMVTSKKTTGFLGFGGRTCHSTPLPVDAIALRPATLLSLSLSLYPFSGCPEYLTWRGEKNLCWLRSTMGL